MRKYKLVVEAELTLEDELDHLEISKFNDGDIYKQIINPDEEEYEYRLSVDFWSGDTGQTIEYADIKTIKVEEITNENN